MSEIQDMSIAALGAAYRERTLSPVEVTEDALQGVYFLNPLAVETPGLVVGDRGAQALHHASLFHVEDRERLCETHEVLRFGALDGCKATRHLRQVVRRHLRAK